MTLGPGFLALAAFAVVLAAISKTGFASGASFVAVPILSLAAPPEAVLALLLPLFMVVDLAGLRAYWRAWDARLARRLCLGALPGVALAAWLHSLAPPDLFRGLIGAISLAFVAFQLARARGWIAPRARPFPPLAGYATGGVAGFTSFISHAGGPPVVIYLLAERLDKTTFQATTVITFWLVNLAKAVPYAALGFFSWHGLGLAVLLVPAALFGAWAGVRAHRLIPPRVFFAVMQVLLAAAGGKLLWDAVS